MATWVAILVGVGAGLLSGLIGTFLTISHERSAEFRTRMLAAAEDFLRTAEACRKAVRIARGNRNQETWEELRDRCDDLYPAVTLVSLLYGYTSKPSLRAQGAGSSFVDVRDELAKGPEADDAFVDEEMKDCAEHLIIFGEVAADQVRRGRLRRKLWPGLRNVPTIPADW